VQGTYKADGEAPIRVVTFAEEGRYSLSRVDDVTSAKPEDIESGTYLFDAERTTVTFTSTEGKTTTMSFSVLEAVEGGILKPLAMVVPVQLLQGPANNVLLAGSDYVLVESFAGKSFTTQCTLDSKLGYYIRAENSFGNGTLTFKRSYYSGPACSDAQLLYHNDDYFTSTDKGIVAGTGGATGFDLTLVKQVMTPVDPRVASSYNQQGACGVTQWTTNVATTIGANTSCSDSPVMRILNKVEGDKLIPGAYPNGFNPLVRPTSLVTDPTAFQSRVDSRP
jgi:hypothetical protein